MAFCPSGCAQDVPVITGAGCRIVTRPAGFDRVIWKRCDLVITSLTDLAEWQTNITDNAVHASGRVLGSKPKGSATKKRVASCLPERTTNYTRNWQWKDSNSDLATLTEFDFYRFVDENQDLLHIAFLTCDDLLYGFFENYSIDVDETRAETNDEDRVIECSVEVKARLITKPVKVPGLSAILT